MSNDTMPKERHPVLLLFTLGGLLQSPCWILTGMTREVVTVNNGGQDIEPQEALIWLIVGLLLCGTALYTLITTKSFTRWNNLPLHTKAIAAIPMVAGSLIGLGILVLIAVSAVFLALNPTALLEALPEALGGLRDVANGERDRR